MPPGMNDQDIAPGQQRLLALQKGGYTAQDIQAYQQRATSALMRGGYSQDEINSYWGVKPNQTQTGDQGLWASIAQHAWDNFTAPVASAWSSLEDQQRQNWNHVFHPSQLELAAPSVAQSQLALRTGQTLWDGMGVVFSPLVGAVNTVTQPATSRLVQAYNIPAPHLTVDLKTPTSNILDPTQWTFKGEMVQGQQAEQTYGNIAAGLGSIGVGGLTPRGAANVTPRAAPAARVAALTAFRNGEIADTAHFPNAAVRGQVSPTVQAQFPANADFVQAAKSIVTAQGSPEAGNRVVHNMQDIWAATGLTPAEQVQIAQKNPILRQQLMAQDLTGQPVAPGYQPFSPPAARSFATPGNAPETAFGQRADPRDLELINQRPRVPTQLASPDDALGLFRRLEGSGDHAISPAGAIGRYQIMPQTARLYGLDPTKLSDPAYNTQAARTILGDLFRRYDGNAEAMAVAYNAGTRHADAYLAAGPGTRLEALPDPSVRSGVRYVRVPSAKDEAGLPMETQRYLANSRRYMAEPGQASEGATQDYVGYSPHVRVPMDDTGRARLGQLRANPEGYFSGIMGRPVTITSAERSAEEQASLVARGRTTAAPNATEHSAANFAAGYGAWDVKVPGMTNQEVIARLARSGLPFDQLIEEGDHVHIGFGPRTRNEIFALRGGHLPEGMEATAGEAAQSPMQAGRWQPEQSLPIKGAAEGEDGESFLSGSLSAASRWDDATPAEVTEELLSNTGEQPRTGLFPDYMSFDRLMSDYVSVLHPFDAVDKALLDAGFLRDPDKDFTTRRAFQQINGAASRMSSFVLDGTVKWDNFNYTVNRDSPSFGKAFAQMGKVGNRDEFVAAMIARRTVNASTRFLDQARMELAKAKAAQEKAAEPFLAENFNLEDENDPRFAKQRKLKDQADAQVQKALQAYQEALNKPGLDTGFNPFAAKRATTDPYWERYDEAIQTYQDTKTGILQYAVDTGRLSKTSMESMLQQDPVHISMQRVGVDSKSAGFAKLGESDRKVVSDPIAADFANGEWIIRQSDRNAAINHMIELASGDPNIMAQFGLKQIKATDKTAIDTEVDQALKQFGFTPEQMDAAREAFEAVIQDRHDMQLKPNQFVRYVDGERQLWEAGDANLARSLRSPAGPGQAEFFMKAAKWAAGAERAGIMVGLDWAPDIGMFHQLTQFAYDPAHPTPVVTLIEGFLNNVLKTDLAARARASGAFSSSIADMKGDYVQHLVEDLANPGKGVGHKLKDFWQDENTTSVSLEKLPWNTVNYPIQFMRLMTELVDESNRTGLYAQGERMKMTPGAAGARARRTGLDYNDRGASYVANLMTQAAPMYQGYLKGTELGLAGFSDVRGARASAVKGARTLAWIGGTLGLATAINYGLNVLQSKDPSIPASLKWENVPNYDKDRYLISPVVAGHRIKLRMPAGVAGAFAALTQRMMDAMWQHDPHAFSGLINDLIQDNIRLPVPALVNAPVEAAANHSFFTGHALIPGHLEGLAPAQQYQPFTSPLAKQLAGMIDTGLGHVGAQAMEFSPIQLDHVIAGWTGPAGAAVLQAAGTPDRPGPPADVASIPGISRLWERDPGTNAQAISDFYDTKSTFDHAYAERTEARRQARGEEYARWLSKGAIGAPPSSGDPMVDQTLRANAVQDAAYAQAQMRLNKISGALGVMRDSVWSIYAAKGMSDDEKRQLIEGVYTQMIQTSRGAEAEMRQFEQEHPLHAR